MQKMTHDKYLKFGEAAELNIPTCDLGPRL